MAANEFPSPMNDSLQRFLFERNAVRGELVHLDATWREALGRHDYPPVVRDLLGQMMAASLLLSATLKFRGSIIMQIQGDGPVNLLVVEATAQRTVRGIAHWNGEVPAGGLQAKFGNGRLVITIDTVAGGEQTQVAGAAEGSGVRYQGIVALEGEDIAAALDAYLERSEQLPTRMWLAADGTQAAGMLLQRLPGEAADSDAWNRIQTLGATITGDELLGLPAQQVVQRLFHEEDVRLLEAEAVSFRCSCSAERVANMLRSLGRDEVNDILRSEGRVEVTCEFCNKRYGYDAVDVEQVFVEQPQPPVRPTQH